jgi:hypothetical protein
VKNFTSKLVYFDPAIDELLVPTNVGTSTIHCCRAKKQWLLHNILTTFEFTIMKYNVRKDTINGEHDIIYLYKGNINCDQYVLYIHLKVNSDNIW